MAFDPNKPVDGAVISAAELRAQMNELKTLAEAGGVGPQGPPGLQGDPGPAGADGAQGPQGPEGPAGPTDVLVTENDPGGAQGTVWIRPSDGTVKVRVGAGWEERGSMKGPQGDPGVDGPQGPEGPQGDPGEVTAQQLTDAIGTAIAGTSSNSNSIPTLDTPYGDPEKEELRAAYNSLVLILRR